MEFLEQIYRIFSPYLGTQTDKEKMFFAKQLAKGILLDIGCGQKPMIASFKNIDRYIGIDLPTARNSRADVFADALALPFKDNCFDVVVCSVVLEHVPDPFKAMEGIGRVLKKKGYLYLDVPQMSRIHGEPHDYFRFTKYGLLYLAKKYDFEVISMKEWTGFWEGIAYLFTFYFIEDFPKIKYTRPLIYISCAVMRKIGRSLDQISCLNRNKAKHSLGYKMILKKL